MEDGRLTVKVSLRTEVRLALFSYCDLRLIALWTAASSYFLRNNHADESRTCRTAASTGARRDFEAATHVDGGVPGAIAAQALCASHRRDVCGLDAGFYPVSSGAASARDGRQRRAGVFDVSGQRTQRRGSNAAPGAQCSGIVV